MAWSDVAANAMDLGDEKMAVRDVFMNACVGVITTASVGTFLTVYEMKTAIATTQSDMMRAQKDIAKVESEIRDQRTAAEQLAIDLAGLRVRCEKWIDQVNVYRRKNE